eukprot:974945-Amphidinium_carterae.1
MYVGCNAITKRDAIVRKCVVTVNVVIPGNQDVICLQFSRPNTRAQRLNQTRTGQPSPRTLGSGSDLVP